MAPKLDEESFAAMVERQKDIVRRENEERQRAAQGYPPRPSSTPAQPPLTPPAVVTPNIPNNNDSGPAPQNTVTPVDPVVSQQSVA